MMGTQYGGEGKQAYSKTSSDYRLPQHGGEGKSLGKKTDTKLEGSKRPKVSGAKLTNV
jgi:hypothetical protein